MKLDEKSILDVEGARAKQCPKCGGTEWYLKPVQPRKKAHNGKRYYAKAEQACLICKRERWKRYYQANKERVLRKNREWYKKNPGKHQEYSRASRRKRT